MGGRALWLKDYVFKTRWMKNSMSFLSVPPLPPGGNCRSPLTPPCLFEELRIKENIGNFYYIQIPPNNRQIIATVYYKYYYSISNLSVILPQSGNYGGPYKFALRIYNEYNY